jgi:hypothetical protein
MLLSFEAKYSPRDYASSLRTGQSWGEFMLNTTPYIDRPSEIINHYTTK